MDFLQMHLAHWTMTAKKKWFVKMSEEFSHLCRQKWLQDVTQKLQLVNHRAGVSPFHLSLGRLWNLGSYAQDLRWPDVPKTRGSKWWSHMKSQKMAKPLAKPCQIHQHFHQGMGGSNFEFHGHGKTLIEPSPNTRCLVCKVRDLMLVFAKPATWKS